MKNPGSTLFRVRDLALNVEHDIGDPVSNEGYVDHSAEDVKHDGDKHSGAESDSHTAEKTGNEVHDNESLRVIHIGDVLAELHALKGVGKLVQCGDSFGIEARRRRRCTLRLFCGWSLFFQLIPSLYPGFKKIRLYYAFPRPCRLQYRRQTRLKLRSKQTNFRFYRETKGQCPLRPAGLSRL